MKHRILILALVSSLSLCACQPATQTVVNSQSKSVQVTSGDSEGHDIPAQAYIAHGETYNPESVIPPQCYTKTDGVNNPCYACHQSYPLDEKRPNVMNDGVLQGTYAFSEAGLTNSWKNLFVDRTALIADISDDFIVDWVTQDNYQPALSDHSAFGLPQSMQIDHLAFPNQAFLANGLAADGSNWVAYNYKPFPSTFWPTNGSTGDAMIRLPEDFRQQDGKDSQQIYFLNLSMVEMAIKDIDSLPIEPVDEQALGIDLNNDGQLSGSVNRLVKKSHYLGDAGDIEVTRMLYPQGTEFLHTVRYIGVDEQGNVFNAPRIKEVRYMRKYGFRSAQSLASAYYAEAKEKHFEKLPQTLYLGEQGIDNKFGWIINGYIEDQKGQLRAQHEQELAFCNGCHKTVGSTFDQTFSFARKVPGSKGWGYINLRDISDAPNINESQGEYLTYMQRVGGGDEFRQNQEMLQRWFDQEGKVNSEKIRRAGSIYALITPSPERAFALNKAYFTIVKEQSYLFGRDATLVEAKNVLQQIDQEQAPLKAEHRYEWDMRLDWSVIDEQSEWVGNLPD